MSKPLVRAYLLRGIDESKLKYDSGVTPVPTKLRTCVFTTLIRCQPSQAQSGRTYDGLVVELGATVWLFAVISTISLRLVCWFTNLLAKLSPPSATGFNGPMLSVVTSWTGRETS